MSKAIQQVGPGLYVQSKVFASVQKAMRGLDHSVEVIRATRRACWGGDMVEKDFLEFRYTTKRGNTGHIRLELEGRV